MYILITPFTNKIWNRFNPPNTAYLGITITDNLDWGQHISEISSKATKTMSFHWRNLALERRQTMGAANKTLVYPQLQYAAPT
ncbi:MAG: hypothetical protein AB2693_14150, partial [Candidatus Thiodiazotropha sp.]